MSEINILDEIEWAIQTIRDQLLFGIDELGAAKMREIRAKGVLLDCKEEITRLKKALSIAEEAIRFYEMQNNWLDIGEANPFDLSGRKWIRIVEDDAFYDHENREFRGGKRAREAQKQIKEVMEGK